jgi:energy-coupling factor transporter ATP-binding protein EcfA2
MSAFKKAVKSQAKLRAAVFGPSGSGKTYTALEIATGIISAIEGGKIALIDSERSSASKYADRFEFDQVDLETKDIDEYVDYIKMAANAGYSVLIIDSLTHAWQMLLDSVEKLAQAKYKGNTWSAWSEGTPEQRKLVDAIVNFPGHVIATMRSKTEWQTTTNDRGKTTPVRVGLAPEQGKGIEYEFDILFEISVDHLAHIIKDRSGKFQDKIIDKPGKDFGRQLIAWLNEGAIPVAPEKPIRQQYDEALIEFGNVLKSKDDFGMNAFSDKEIEEVRLGVKAELAKLSQPEQKLVYLTETLNKQKELLHVRLEASEATIAAQEANAAAQATKTQEEPFDDGFVDDIPEMNEKPGKGNKGQKKKNKANSGKSETAESADEIASEELDIF